jgi:hypothetical protein
MRIDRARDRSQIDAVLDQWLARWCSIQIVARRVPAKCPRIVDLRIPI